MGAENAGVDGMIIDLIWRELETPTGQVGPLTMGYQRAVVGLGHAIVGAALAASLGVWGIGAAMLLAVAYWLVKERGDLRRGGGLRDGLEDAAMVALGTYYGPWWWPLVMLLCGLYLMAVGAME